MLTACLLVSACHSFSCGHKHFTFIIPCCWCRSGCCCCRRMLLITLDAKQKSPNICSPTRDKQSSTESTKTTQPNVKGQRLGAMLCYNDDDDERTTNFDNNRPDCDAMMLWRPRDDCFQINLTFANLIRKRQRATKQPSQAKRND